MDCWLCDQCCCGAECEGALEAGDAVLERGDCATPLGSMAVVVRGAREGTSGGRGERERENGSESESE